MVKVGVKVSGIVVPPEVWEREGAEGIPPFVEGRQLLAHWGVALYPIGFGHSIPPCLSHLCLSPFDPPPLQPRLGIGMGVPMHNCLATPHTVCTLLMCIQHWTIGVGRVDPYPYRLPVEGCISGYTLDCTPDYFLGYYSSSGSRHSA